MLVYFDHIAVQCSYKIAFGVDLATHKSIDDEKYREEKKLILDFNLLLLL